VLEGFPERYFTGKKAVFKQKIKIKSQEDFKLKILYNFMACKTACFPPEEREIELTIKGLASAEAPEQIATTDTSATVALQPQPVGYQKLRVPAKDSPIQKFLIRLR
jgi:thiol:disulfide interchange protein